MTSTRQQRRVQQRELRKSHATLLKHGFALERTPDNILSLCLLFRDILKTKGDRRVIEVAKSAHQIFDKSETNNPPSQPLACKAGCSYCCYTFVSLLAPEAFLIAEQIKPNEGDESASSIEQFLERSKPLRGLDADGRFEGERQPCPILLDQQCSVYETRPIACRRYSSFDVAPCKLSFEGGPDQIPLDRYFMDFGRDCSVALSVALRSCGYPDTGYELSEAVTTILQTDNALARWTNGEDVLAGVQIDTSRSNELNQVIGEMAASIS